MPAELDLERLYDAHAQSLFAYLLNLTRDEQETRDLLQEVFVKLARRPEVLSQAKDERGYLIRLAHNAAIDLMRRRETRDKHHTLLALELSSLFDTGADPDEEVFRHQLSNALGQLPAEQRAVIHLKLWEDLTFEKIGVVIGISPNTAASRYRYAIDKLRELLRPLYREIQ